MKYAEKEYEYKGDLQALEQIHRVIMNWNKTDGVTPVLLATIASIEVDNHMRNMRLEALESADTGISFVTFQWNE